MEREQVGQGVEKSQMSVEPGRRGQIGTEVSPEACRHSGQHKERRNIPVSKVSFILCAGVPNERTPNHW